MPTSTPSEHFLASGKAKERRRIPRTVKPARTRRRPLAIGRPTMDFWCAIRLSTCRTASRKNDLSIYTYNETDHSYAFYGLSRNNSRVRTPKLTIEEKRWTYSGEFEDNGKKIRFRTINDFTTPATVTYRAEYSEDGAHWTLMSEGATEKIK